MKPSFKVPGKASKHDVASRADIDAERGLWCRSHRSRCYPEQVSDYIKNSELRFEKGEEECFGKGILVWLQ